MYSAASGDRGFMTGIAVSTDDHDLDRNYDDDPFAAATYVVPVGKTSSSGHHDDRLDTRLIDWQGDGGSTKDLRDEEDYSRRVLPFVANGGLEKKGKLGIRNVTDRDLA